MVAVHHLGTPGQADPRRRQGGAVRRPLAVERHEGRPGDDGLAFAAAVDVAGRQLQDALGVDPIAARLHELRQLRIRGADLDVALLLSLFFSVAPGRAAFTFGRALRAPRLRHVDADLAGPYQVQVLCDLRRRRV